MNKPIGYSHNDKYLVDKVLRGDSRCFGTIVNNTEALVAQIVFKMIPNAEDRKDIAQDIYLKAFDKLGSFKFESRLSTWIAQIAYNTCMSWLEKKKLVFPGDLHEDRSAHEEASESLYRLKQLSAILQSEIANLPPVYQTLITLYHHETLSYEEMAQITGLPDGTMKSYLFRARKMLKENILSKYKKEAL